MPEDRPYVIYIDDRLIACDDRPGAQQCTAKTARGPRCKMVVQGDQITGWREVTVPGWGMLTAYDLGGDFCDKDRWLAQRCERHWPEAPAAADPEWAPFDPAQHEPVRLPPAWGLVWDAERKIVEYRLLPKQVL